MWTEQIFDGLIPLKFLSIVDDMIWNLDRASTGPVGLSCAMQLVKAKKPALQLVLAKKLALQLFLGKKHALQIVLAVMPALQLFLGEKHALQIILAEMPAIRWILNSNLHADLHLTFANYCGLEYTRNIKILKWSPKPVTSCITLHSLVCPASALT